MKNRWKRVVIALILLASLLFNEPHTNIGDNLQLAVADAVKTTDGISKLAAGNRYKSGQEIKHERKLRQYMAGKTRAESMGQMDFAKLYASDLGTGKKKLIIPVGSKSETNQVMSEFVRRGYIDCRTGQYTRTTRYSNGMYKSKTYSCILVKKPGKKAKRQLKKLVKLYDKKVKRNLTDVELMARTQDFLAKNFSYDINARNYSIAKLLQSRRAVCWGYSALYCYLLGSRGVDANIYLQNKINHQCNSVKIGGRTYWIDPTWGDVPSLNQYMNPSARGVGGTYLQFFLMNKKDRKKHDKNKPITLKYAG